ncbi:MAG TPA: arginine deiminase-related protein [Saprospiraceae bacterium]|nr:arginine deiminase-related protein [Saprospiraceae bacterium]
MKAQTTSDLIMIRPAAFGYNSQTAENNTFQHVPQMAQQEIHQRALAEFDELVKKLRAEGVNVKVFDDTADPVKPDAIFPNNWVSFHDDGRIITYPMYSPLRRLERRNDILLRIAEDYGFEEKVDLEDYEDESLFLEGTGSMVLDRVNKIAYACLSQRTNPDILEKWCDLMDYRSFTFHAQYDGQDIYHTNVMMAIGEGIAVVCFDVVEETKRDEFMDLLAKSGHEIVKLSEAQVGSFAGNMLAVKNKKGEQLMVMSGSAYRSLTPEQINQIEKHARIVHSDVDTIESVGGGSVRCMIAENFLPHL